MEGHPSKTKRKFHLPEQFVPIGFLWVDVIRDKDAFRVLIACTLAMITTGLEPAFLTLSTSEIQNELRTPESHAPMYIAVGFLVLAVLTLVAGTSGDLFGRKRVLLVGLTGPVFVPFVVGLLVGSFLVARLTLRFGAGAST